jgi:hypothetical protein
VRVAFALALALAAASAGCSSLLGIDDLRLGDDAPPGPAGGDAPGVNCIGGGLLWVCPDPAPTSELAVVGPQAIDTGTDPACVTMRSGTVEVCAIVRGSIEIAAAATLRVVGPRPLVLASMSTISVLGAIDAASYLGKPAGAGGDPQPCQLIAPPAGAGGGAGGSFGGNGGNGGSGGSMAPPRVTTLTEIRGGCAGGIGGDKGAQPAGSGGGAIYLIARDSILISGRINASGAGGGGADNSITSGGSGGGAGGLIGLDAPSISGAGTLFANGGGGGGGGGLFIAGKPGTESTDAKSPGLGGSGSGGGDGGDGSVGTTLDGASGLNGPSGAGGGGGGGAGAIYARGMFTVAGAISPPATIVTP